MTAGNPREKRPPLSSREIIALFLLYAILGALVLVLFTAALAPVHIGGPGGLRPNDLAALFLYVVLPLFFLFAFFLFRNIALMARRVAALVSLLAFLYVMVSAYRVCPPGSGEEECGAFTFPASSVNFMLAAACCVWFAYQALPLSKPAQGLPESGLGNGEEDAPCKEQRGERGPDNP